MARIVKHVKRTKAKGRFYYYFDTGQLDDYGRKIWKRLPDPSDRSFGGVYASMLGHRERRGNLASQMTIGQLIALYQASDKFTAKIADSTRTLYTLYQRHLTDQLGNAPAQAVERRDIVLLLDKMADRPGAANMVKRAGAAAYAWGRQRGHVTNNPFADIEEMDTREHEPWSDAELQAGLTAGDDIVRLAVHLLYYTAQRIGDVAAMKWRDIQDGCIHLTQQKTGKDLVIPIHQDLQAELNRHERTLATIIPGRPTEAKLNRLRLAMQEVCAVDGRRIVPHGLRKNAVNTLLEAECSVAQTAAISGQSLQMVEKYARRRNQQKLGRAAILKWEGTKG